MSSEPVEADTGSTLELPVDELLRRARPLPPSAEMVIEDITDDEGAAFLAALEA
ncbi:MAG TPA: hypothetical protein VHM89_16300 [Acidimicrobiales bacterium]|nr:hypothetical protein [Acidimicrobiales bacterium]